MANDSLVDIIDHLLNRGTVLLGRSTISVADVDLVDIELQIVLSSIETLHGKAVSSKGQATTKNIQNYMSASEPTPLVETSQEEEQYSALQSGPGEQPDEHAEDIPGRFTQPEIPAKEGHQAQRDVTDNQLPKVTLPSLDGGGEPPERGLARLALTIVEILRQIVERQAIRRMDGGVLAEKDVERMGVALMELEAKMTEIRDMFGLEQQDLELDLGPLEGLLS